MFPDDIKDKKRIAYSHNGIGRHSMFCFNNIYQLETWKDNQYTKCDVIMSDGDSAFKLENVENSNKIGLAQN